MVENRKPVTSGDTVSHYRIVEELGGGGMGIVYKASDLRLNRFVALKFLPTALTGDDAANARFRQEAQAASALDHPNICTIHEIDETTDGRLFLALAFYDGQTLKKRIAGGPLPVAEALEIAIQTARGLASAHQSGIVHRDIKPANLMITAEGLVKIVDFGIAKLSGDADLTRTGTTLGTVAYMAPEQVRGEEIGPPVDTWALGVVLHEMIAGERPFVGQDDVAVLAGILESQPPSLSSDGVPPELQRIVGRALEKPRGERYRSAAEMLSDLISCRDTLAARATGGRDLLRQLRRPALTIPAVVLSALAIGMGAWMVTRVTRARWVRDEAVPEIMRLTEREQFSEAFALAQQVKDAGDPVLAGLWSQFASPVTIVTDPDGADVYVKEYAAGEDRWAHFGRTPITAASLPRGVFQFRIEKAGHDSLMVAARNPGSLLGANRGSMKPVTLLLIPAASRPGMVPVPGGAFPVSLSGFTADQPATLNPFLIDRYEVTNKQYKLFVDNGGYQNERLWSGLPSWEVGVSWRERVARFRDTTDRPAPAAWELGRYPVGHDEYPVAGVSWYEAAAYCRDQGKELPTLFHFARAALAPDEIGSPLAPAILPLSNFGTSGPVPVGKFRGMGPFGTFDMGGNVKEWIWNEASEHRRWVLGGAWSDPTWMLLNRDSAPPLDRLPTIGFRCAVSAHGHFPDQTLATVDTVGRDLRRLRPVSGEVFEVFRRQLAYAPVPLDERVESVNTARPDWVIETVSLAAGYQNERITTRLFLPRTGKPPYQAMVYFPGLGPFAGPESSQNLEPALLDFIVRSGRALVWPVFKGSYERWDPFLNLQGEENLRTMRTRMVEWRQDLGRVLDLLSTRQEIDASRVGFIGASFGASVPLPLLAVENRLKVAVLLAPGLSFRALPPEADAINYAHHITMPVLMVGGRHDYVLPYETSQRPLFEQLGTPADRKRHVVFDSGHFNFPRTQLVREVLAWLDQYLGPSWANRRSSKLRLRKTLRVAAVPPLFPLRLFNAGEMVFDGPIEAEVQSSRRARLPATSVNDLRSFSVASLLRC